MNYFFYDYCISENILISDMDILGIEASKDPDKLYLVNTDGLAFEISKKAWEEIGLTIGNIYNSCVEDINQIDEAYIDYLGDLGWLSDTEREELFSMIPNRY